MPPEYICNLTVRKLPATRHVFFWSHLVLLQEKTSVLNSRIQNVTLNLPLSTLVIRVSCLVFDFDFPVKGLCWLAEGD